MDVMLSGVVKGYPEGGVWREVLRGVELMLPSASLTALVGPSGSGKTTLLNLIAGIDRPEGGSIRIGGVELTRLSEDERTRFRRRNMGFIFQMYNLIPTLTVMENLLFMPRLNRQPEKESRLRVEEMLERLGLKERRQAFPDALSGGERQRVALIRGLAHQPGLVLADEPTGNLDRGNGREVMRLLVEMVNNRKATLILVTHDREMAASTGGIHRLTDGVLQPGFAP
ncbi:MAG: ABC transporter ATP-binding protein [Magnetococcales bacterium]|nr:ABC transporter ATP-binding protein [Magnetococcales bacterium]